jgi:2-polyprenyl-3-methyl-5-hydroxy-6-metoxy-1,4-benzoquinol methylase
MGSVKKVYTLVTHLIGKVTKKYYFEDYVRVYPDRIVFNRFGRKVKFQKDHLNNFLNHCKFYKFAAQFVKDKRVVDIGCGSGYGCQIMKKGGAALVCGSDASRSCIKFAKSKYGDWADFTVQGATDMRKYPDSFFDIAVSSEVLEHIKEYGMEQRATDELKRITKDNGLLIIGTPNSEMLGRHGFYFEEIDALLHKNFKRFCIFENALVPFGDKKHLWEKRLSDKKTGVIISELIDLSETVLPKGKNPELKTGIPAGKFKFATLEIDTTLLHNTHSWIVVAKNDK